MSLVTVIAASLINFAPWQSFESKAENPAWTFAAKDADIAEGGWVTAEFVAGWKGVVKERPFYFWSGIVFSAWAYDSAGKKLHLKAINYGDGDRAETPGKVRFALPKDAHKFAISFGPYFAKGAFSLRGVKISLAPFDARFPPIEYKGKTFEYDERGKPPKNPAKLPDGAAFGLFRVDSPRRTFDRYPPEQDALGDAFELAAAPGEVADLFIGIYAERDVSVAAAPGRFLKDGGEVLAAAPGLYRALNRPNSAGHGHIYWVAPEVLMPFAELPDLKAKTSALAMAQFRIPGDAAPGVYSGVVEFSCGEETHAAKVRLTVLPFKVSFPRPDEYQTILHVSRYGDDPAFLVRVCRDARARGAESLLIGCQYGNGQIKLEKRNGKLAIRSFDRLDHAVAAFKAAGMKGTLYVHFSDKLEVAVARAIGVDFPDGPGEQTNMIPEMQTDSFKAACVEALHLVRERAAGVEIAVLAMDEPSNDKRMPRSVWEIERIRDAGMKSALYGDARSYDNSHPDIMLCSTKPGATVYEHFRDEVEKRGALHCRYGGTGSYGYAFGGLMPSRILHGWGDYLTPECKGHTIWTVMADDTFEPGSLSHMSRYGSVYNRSADGRFLSTLQLEGCYEGMRDYAYLKELERRLAAAKGCAKAKRISEELEALKKQMWDVIPYRLDADLLLDPEKAAAKRITNAEAEAARAKVAKWICELDCSR